MKEYLARKEAGTATRSDLFWEFIRIRAETKPLYFLLENVKMKKEYMEIFNRAVGFEPAYIDAAILGPQNRKRLYWLGKRNPDGTYSRVDIEQPEDAGMKLKDILEDIPFDAVDTKGKPIWKPVPEKYIPRVLGRLEKFVDTNRKVHCIDANYGKV
jgi:site-specific DNA-cytosine methylase